MNSHTDIQRRLSAYCSGDLETTERILIEAHLTGCPECRADLADMQTALRLMRTTPEVDPPTWLKSRIMAHLREENTARKNWLQRIWFPQHTGLPVKMLALLVVCISGYYLSYTVETEMKQTARQELRDTPAQPSPVPLTPPALSPAGQKRQEPQVAVPLQKPDLPAAAPQAAPRHESVPAQPLPQVPAAPAPATYAPPPPAYKDQYSNKQELHKSAPVAESSTRSLEAAPEKKMKSSRSMADRSDAASPSPAAAGRAASAPSGRALQQTVVRISVNDPVTATSRIREAVARSGGSITEDHTFSGQHLKVRIPANRLQELFERLERLGRITQRPAAPPIETQTVEMTVEW